MKIKLTEKTVDMIALIAVFVLLWILGVLTPALGAEVVPPDRVLTRGSAESECRTDVRESGIAIMGARTVGRGAVLFCPSRCPTDLRLKGDAYA